MAKSRPKKIIFCKYKYSSIVEITPWNPKAYKDAEHCVKVHNDKVIGPNGELGDEFWFLNETIDDQQHIIILASEPNYPSNKPEIYEKLRDYIIENDIEQPKGNFQRRDSLTVPIPEIPEAFLKYERSSAQSAELLCNKLKDKLGDNGSCRCITEGGKHYVIIRSYSYSQEQLFVMIKEIKEQK